MNTNDADKAAYISQLNREKRAILAAMKQQGIRKVSCFNGGHSAESYRLNSELFKINTLIGIAKR